MNESEARKIAEKEFLKICERYNLDRKACGDPVHYEFKGDRQEYEWWTPIDKYFIGALVTVHEDGRTKVNLLDARSAHRSPDAIPEK